MIGRGTSADECVTAALGSIALAEDIRQVRREGEHACPPGARSAIGDIDPTEVGTARMIIRTNAAWSIERNARPIAGNYPTAGMLYPDEEVRAGRNADVCRDQPAIEDLCRVGARQLQKIGRGADNDSDRIIGAGCLVQSKRDGPVAIVGQASGIRGGVKEMTGKRGEHERCADAGGWNQRIESHWWS